MNRRKLQVRGEPELTPVSRGSWLDSVTRFWVTTVVVMIIIYVALLVISRTAGFRDLVRQSLEQTAGLPLEVGSVSMNPWLEFTVSMVAEKGMTNRLPALLVEKAAFRVRLIPLLRKSGWPFRNLRIEGASFRFFEDKDGTWAPLSDLHAALAPWAGIETTVPFDAAAPTDPGPGITDYLRIHKARLHMENVRVAWIPHAADTPPAAVVEGLSLNTATVRPFDENILWLQMHIAEGQRDGAPWMKDLRLEWIRQRDQDVILKIDGDLYPSVETGARP